MSHPDEEKKSLPDSSGDAVSNTNFRARDALEQYAQGLLDGD